MTDPPEPASPESAHWRSLLSGEDLSLQAMRRRMRRLPTGPRCKVCSAPFHGVGAVFTRLVLHGQSTANPTMCQVCFRSLSDHPGGAELDVSIVFADIRGSTGLAERIGPVGFRAALQEFYRIAAGAYRSTS